MSNGNYRTYETLLQSNSSMISELCLETNLPPSHYLFLSTTKLQILTYIRPIDIIFTVLMLSTK